MVFPMGPPPPAISGAARTKETALLAPECTVDKINALVLTGGSAQGLSAADGVMRYSRRGVGGSIPGLDDPHRARRAFSILPAAGRRRGRTPWEWSLPGGKAPQSPMGNLEPGPGPP